MNVDETLHVGVAIRDHRLFADHVHADEEHALDVDVVQVGRPLPVPDVRVVVQLMDALCI